MITVIRSSPGGTDEYGDPIDGTETVFEIDGVIAPRTSTDVDDRGRTGIVVGLSVYVQGTDHDVLRTDQFEYRGERWDVDGEIGVYESPFGDGCDGLEFALKRGEG